MFTSSRDLAIYSQPQPLPPAQAPLPGLTENPIRAWSFEQGRKVPREA